MNLINIQGFVGDIPISDYVKDKPPFILELKDNPNSIHSSWIDQSYKDKTKNGEFNNCVLGLMPSMVLAPKVQYKYNNKIYEENEINLIHSCPGTGASLMIFRNPEYNPYQDIMNWSLTGRKFGE